MVRPTKYRRVECFPKETYFIPIGKKKCDIDNVLIKVEEIEAMRLKDIEKLNQEECAKRMEVSRQTFQNIIDSAREKVAIALTEGKAIDISGGNYRISRCELKCNQCGVDYPGDSANYGSCPKCGSSKHSCGKNDSLCKKWCNKL